MLDRACQPVTLVGAAAVDGSQVGEPQPLFPDRFDPADADGHRHFESGRDIGSPPKPVGDDGEKQHYPATECDASDEP